jgi:hypothetical protein
MKPKNEIIFNSMRALYELSFPHAVGGESGSRLRVFHAILLFTREDKLDLSRKVIVAPFSAEEKELIQLTERDGLAGRNPIGIPSYAVDRHNSRGKGGGVHGIFHYGQDTRRLLEQQAEKSGIDIRNWPEEEIAKSHGPGRRFFASRSYGQPTLLSQFFDEGSWVDKEVTPGNSYRAEAIEFYMYWEQYHGSTMAKSTYIFEEQLKLLRDIQQNQKFPFADLNALADEPATGPTPPPPSESEQGGGEGRKPQKSRVQGRW